MEQEDNIYYDDFIIYIDYLYNNLISFKKSILNIEQQLDKLVYYLNNHYQVFIFLNAEQYNVINRKILKIREIIYQLKLFQYLKRVLKDNSFLTPDEIKYILLNMSNIKFNLKNLITINYV